MDPIVHFEIPVGDANRAGKFYADTFGWKVNPVEGMPYTLVYTTEIEDKHFMPKEAGRINGGMMQRQGPVASPVLTIQVKDIDAALAKLAGNGGEVVVEKREVQGMGITAYFKDPEGNVLGLWQSLGAP